MDFIINKATIDDVFALAKLHIEVEQQTYAQVLPGYIENCSGIAGRERIWRLALSDSDHRRHVLTIKDKKKVIVGFLSSTILEGNTAHHLGAIYLLKKHQSAGLGTQIIAHYAKILESKGIKTFYCDVPSDCKSARAFFAWTGGVESRGDIFLSSRGIIQMTKVTWNNVPQLVKYLDLSIKST